MRALQPGPKADPSDGRGYELEGIQQGCQTNLGWRVLVSHDNLGLAFCSVQVQKLEAVTNGADVAWVGMKQVYGPVLGGLSIVSKWSCDLELQGPFAWDQQVRRSLGPDLSTIRRHCVEVFGNGPNELGLTVWPNAGLELLEGGPAAV